LLLNQFDQFCAKLRVRQGFAALHDQVALARNRRRADLPPAVPVRMREAHERRTRHFKILEDAVIHQRDALRGHALHRRTGSGPGDLARELLHGGVVSDAEKFRQDLLADFFSKMSGLPLRLFAGGPPRDDQKLHGKIPLRLGLSTARDLRKDH